MDITTYVCDNYTEDNELVEEYKNDLNWNSISKIIKGDLWDYINYINWKIYFEYCEYQDNFDLDILDRIKDLEDLDWKLISKKVKFDSKGLEYFKYYIVH